MNLLQSQKGILKAAILFLGLALLAGRGFSGAIQRTDQGQLIRWKSGSSIPYVINPGGVPGFSGELQRLVVIGAVNEAFRPWTEIPDAAVSFNYSGPSPLTHSTIDGTNLVTFQDTVVPFPPGVLAFALVASATAAGPTQVGGQVINAEFVGQILDADIVFNPNPGNEPFSPVGANNTIDLIAVGTHEAGHFLGLDHTGVFSSIMNPFAESGAGVANRSVQTDDTNTVAFLYPAATFAPSRGEINGRITSGGAPVKSANVVAFSSTGGVPIGSALTDADGRYTIVGLNPGSYHVFVEPLDGPISLFDFPGFYSNGSANFATTFFPASGTFTTVNVSAGQAAPPVDISVSPRTAATLNIDQLGISTATGNGTSFTFGSSPLFLPRGKSYNIFVTGQTLPSDANLTAFGSGITGGPTTGTFLPNNQPIRQQTITISPTAALGSSNLHLGNSASTSVMPGAIITTVNPVMGIPLRNSGGFTDKLAPGTLVSIFGTDLASGRGSNGTEGWLGPPAPTSLGGVSVKVGSRFAPLFFVSPGQINALIPYETPVGATQITIVTGPGAQGNTVNVNIDPTAPGIFTVGGEQGAVLNGTDNTVAAPEGTFPGSHPARPGDIVVIYASGMGPVTPSLPSGIGSTAEGTAVPLLNSAPTVLIGGQTAAIHFAGLAPGFVGLYQLNVAVPSGIQTGPAVPVVVSTAQGQTSNTATMAVGP